MTIMTIMTMMTIMTIMTIMTTMTNRQRQPDILLLRCEGKTTAPWLRYIITFVG